MSEIEVLRNDLQIMKVDQQAHENLKIAFEEIKKRCVKHQKSEIEIKKQLTGYQSFIVSVK